MKKIIFLASLLCCSVTFLFSQEVDGSQLIQYKWVLSSDTFTGLGSHKHLADQTALQFKSGGQWISSPAILGKSTGKWSADDKGNLVMWAGDDQKIYITEQIQDKLKLVIKKSTGKRVMTWQGSRITP
jgi:hypothetical protein